MLNADEEADFWVVYQKTAETLFRKAYRMCRGQQVDAEDAHQRTYIKALEHWAVFRELGERQRLAWLTTTLAREILQIWRAPYRARETEPHNDVKQFGSVAPSPDSADRLANVEAYRRTCRAIALLEGRQHDVIVLHCLAGYEISEVAEMLGITGQTVRVHLHVGRQRLKKIMAEDEEHGDDRVPGDSIA